MNEYDDMLDQAEEEANAEIAAKLAELGEFDAEKLRAAFAGREDEQEIELLIEYIGKAADAREKRIAWAALGANAGVSALKLAKKVLLAVAVFGIFAGTVTATPIDYGKEQTIHIVPGTQLYIPSRVPAAPAAVSIPVAHGGLVNLDPFFDGIKKGAKRSRLGIAVDLTATTKSVGYTPLAWDKHRNYWDLGLGLDAKNADKVALRVGFGINLVALSHDGLKNLLGSRVGLLELPGLWIGPVISAPDLDNIKARWSYREKIDIYLTYAFFGGK